jgi:hypothetical protein
VRGVADRGSAWRRAAVPEHRRRLLRFRLGSDPGSEAAALSFQTSDRRSYKRRLSPGRGIRSAPRGVVLRNRAPVAQRPKDRRRVLEGFIRTVGGEPSQAASKAEQCIGALRSVFKRQPARGRVIAVLGSGAALAMRRRARFAL